MILVTGATGTVGGEIVRRLASSGVPVRGMVRDPAKAARLPEAVQVAVGDFATSATLNTAMEGIDRVFLASFDGPDQTTLQGNVITAAKRRNVQHIVRLSSMAAGEKPHIEPIHMHGIGERRLEESGVAFTHLRPSWFMQNFLFLVVDDVIRLPVGEGCAGFVDARDVAAVAVAVLTGPGHAGKAYMLTGPEALSHADVARQLTEAIGRSVTFEDISPETYERTMISLGRSRPSIDTMLALYGDVRANVDTTVTDTVERVTGHSPIRFSDFARDYASAF